MNEHLMKHYDVHKEIKKIFDGDNFFYKLDKSIVGYAQNSNIFIGMDVYELFIGSLDSRGNREDYHSIFNQIHKDVLAIKSKNSLEERCLVYIPPLRDIKNSKFRKDFDIAMPYSSAKSILDREGYEFIYDNEFRGISPVYGIYNLSKS